MTEQLNEFYWMLKTSVNDAERAVQTLWAANRNAVRSNLMAEMQNSLVCSFIKSKQYFIYFCYLLLFG
jgi:hypothetical protein